MIEVDGPLWFAGTLDVAGARSICDRASPGPWEVDDTEGRASIETADGFAVAYPAEHGSMHTIKAHGRLNSIENARFIAFARTALPAALDRIEELERLLGEACGELEDTGGEFAIEQATRIRKEGAFDEGA